MSHSTRQHRAGEVGIAGLILLALLSPAIANGLPLVFSDTGTYLEVGWANVWLADRSSFYGFFLKPFVLFTNLDGLWLGLLPQVLVLAFVLLTLSRRLKVGSGVVFLPLLLLVTTAPWHAAQLMPDIYAPIVLLLGWLGAMRDPTKPGSPLLWLAVVLACLTHSTLPAVLVTAVVVTLTILRVGGLPWKQVGRRLLALALVLTAIVGIQLFANHHFTGKAAYSPRSSAFLYARLNEDGLIEPWLARNCPTDARIRDLCRIAPTFERDSQELLWGIKSPFRRTIWAQSFEEAPIDWDAQLGVASRGALMAQPLTFASAALHATLEQFFSFKVLDDECPQVCLTPKGGLQRALQKHRPYLREKVNSSPQMRGALPRRWIEAMTGLSSYVGLLGLIVLIPVAVRRHDTSATSLLLAIFFSLLANAFVTGSLSDVHFRYQSRLIWLAPVACLLVLFRWRTIRAHQTVETAGGALVASPAREAV